MSSEQSHLVGYVDQWSLRPGDTVTAFVSATEPFKAQLVRLIHGDQNPRGPGFKERVVDLHPVTSCPARIQPIDLGSFGRVDFPAELRRGSLMLCAAIWPTRVGHSRQGLLSIGSTGGVLESLSIDTDGCLEWSLPLDVDEWTSVRTRRPVAERRWYYVVAALDAVQSKSWLCVWERDEDPTSTVRSELVIGDLASRKTSAESLDFLMGARARLGRVAEVSDPYNGKIANVRVFSCAVPASDDLATLFHDEVPTALESYLEADWDFARDIAGRVAPDRSRHRRAIEFVNRPTRAVTGPNWTGHFDRVHDAPSEYNSVHLHDDDLEDARWDPVFSWKLPDRLDSGVYAAKLVSASETRYVPFFIRRPMGTLASRTAVLIPTLSYMAYSNESLNPEILGALTPLRNPHLQANDYAYLGRHQLRSTYDLHSDGSGISTVTRLRPILTSTDPLHRGRVFDAPHQLGADLHLIDWLVESGIPHDVITDHDLHFEGVDVLRPYACVLTGTHAEYWTGKMLDAVQAYTKDGGRLVYLSGNGLYWVTALDETGTIAEVRRVNGSGSWRPLGGEGVISLSEEFGGIWKERGRPPQQTVGVGFAAQGFDRGSPYRRLPGSYDPRVAFAFEGITDELIGDFPVLTMNYGAAGFEIDRADAVLGTPSHALRVATSTGYSDSYQFVKEEVYFTTPYDGGTRNPEVRCDMVFFECPNGGAVFSMSSIAFCSALYYNNYQNNVSRLLGNVVRAFASGDHAWSGAASEC